MEGHSDKDELVPLFASGPKASLKDIRCVCDDISMDKVIHELVNTLPNVVMILNESQQIVFANQALLDMFGYGDINDVLGLCPSEVFCCAYAGGDICGSTPFCQYCGAARTIFQAQRGRPSNSEECRIARKGGDALDLRVWAAPVALGGHNLTVFTIADISDEKRRSALERIFFHDIVNTAGGILGLSEVMLGSLSEADRQCMSMINSAAEILMDEIEAQRQLLAAENSSLAVSPDAFMAGEVIKRVMAVYAKHDASNGKELAVAPDSADVRMVSDRALLCRVLGNMVKNALEASKPGGRVTIKCEDMSSRVAFVVHNAGEMPKDEQMQVFQRSFSTKGKGRGLGTYSVRLLVEQYLKGKASFSSTREEGTSFRVELPVELKQPS